MSSRHRIRKFWKKVFYLFLVYLFVAAGVYLLLDFNSAARHFARDPFELIMAIAGVAFVAAFSIAYWLRRDPELRRY